MVTEPVQTELDSHKKSSKARLKRRALAWTQVFRQLIRGNQTDCVVRPSNPRVVVRLAGSRPDTQRDDVLDRSVADDALVAIALTVRSQHNADTVAVFSDDVRPMHKASLVGLDASTSPMAGGGGPNRLMKTKSGQGWSGAWRSWNVRNPN